MFRHKDFFLASRLRRFCAATAGGIAIWTAVALPPVAVVAVGAVELASVSSDRRRLQNAADSAALSAARELGFAGPNGVTQRAQAYAVEQVAEVTTRQTVAVTATIGADNRSVSVEMQANRMSFFGNLLPPGGFDTLVVSTASALGNTPLCVVGMRTTSGANIHLYDKTAIQSAGCLVHSNRDVQVDTSSRIDAGEVQVSGGVNGGQRINPTALVGAPPLADPFADRNVAFPSTCNANETDKFISGPVTWQPGMHCGDYEVRNNAVLTLAPGIHYFRDSDLKTRNSSTLYGNGVTLIFDQGSHLEAIDRSIIHLWGTRRGLWAGFLMVGPRSNGEAFIFASDEVDRLEGVIYLPSSLLAVSGTARTAELSRWTVTLASYIEVRGSTSLVINVDYSGSDVPVPAGVGPQRGTRLRR